MIFISRVHIPHCMRFFVYKFKLINNMKKKVIGIVFLIFAFAFAVWIARPEKNKKNNTASISASVSGSLVLEETDNYDFGEISMSAGKVNHRFKIKNTSSEPINIKKIYTFCMCTTAELIKKDKHFGPYGMPGHQIIPKINEEISPKEEFFVEAVFDPAAHGPAGVGRIQREIIIENNDGEPIKLQFTAVVTP